MMTDRPPHPEVVSIHLNPDRVRDNSNEATSSSSRDDSSAPLPKVIVSAILVAAHRKAVAPAAA